MLEEPLGVLCGHRIQRPAHRLDQGLWGSCSCPPQQPFHLRERLLDGVEVRRRVGRQGQRLATSLLDQLSHPLALVRPEVLSSTTTCPAPAAPGRGPDRRRPRRAPRSCSRPPPSRAPSLRSSCSPRGWCSCRGCAAPSSVHDPRAASRRTGPRAKCSSPSRRRTPTARRPFPRRRAPARRPSRTRRVRSLPPVFFSGPSHATERAADGGLAHPEPCHAPQVLAPPREGGAAGLSRRCAFRSLLARSSAFGRLPGLLFGCSDPPSRATLA